MSSSAHDTPDRIRLGRDLDRETLLEILDNSFDEIFVTDGNGVVIYVNKACQDHYGLKAEEILGKKAKEVGDQGYWFPHINPVVLEQRQQVTAEQRTSVGKNLLVTATPVFNPDGSIALVVTNCRDITDINAIKQDLEQARKLVKRYADEVQVLQADPSMKQGMVAHSQVMKNTLELARRVAKVDSTVMILGESGTGKGVLARYIHDCSPRHDRPFITVSCPAIPDALFESELFGYARGAFTGANAEGKIGLVEVANKGTLFLDEIAEIPLRLQAKLLEMIQHHQFLSVGGREVKNVDVRIVAATNRDLPKMVQDGTFREDLFYRLNVIELMVPPLRERRGDVMPLIYLFLNRFDRRYGTHHGISQWALDLMLDYPWPGNVREIEHVLERLVVTVGETTILPEHLPSRFHQAKPGANAEEDRLGSLDEAIETTTRKLVAKAYERYGSSYKVAEVLGVSQSKASRLIRRYVSSDNRSNPNANKNLIPSQDQDDDQVEND